MKALKELDKESILSEEVYTELLAMQDEIEKARLLLKLEDRAGELGVKRSFQKMLKAYKETIKSMRDEVEKDVYSNRWTDFNIPSDEKFTNMACGSWIANHNGIVCYNIMGMEIRASYQPILPIERLENVETNEEQITLAFYRDNKWKKIKVSKEMISSASKIVSLSRFGLSVTSENARHLVKYLNDVENLNGEDIELHQSTSKLGWHGDDFIPYDNSIIFDGESRFKQLFDSIGAAGNYDVWLDHVRMLRATGRPEVKFMLAASFASVLIKPLGILPFFVDLWGETEGGKSVSLMLAASVWANPDASQYIGDYKSTDVALEVRADVLNNLPVLLDDTSNATKKIVDDFENIIYRLCSGKGKSRSNKDLGTNRENTWKNCFITNGERALSGYVTQGGAINRIIEIEADTNIYQNPQATATLLKMNYGHAGKIFVEEVKKIENLRERFDMICQELFQTDKMQKQAMSLACILLADRIATETIFHDNACISMDEAKKTLIDRSELSEGERCYQYLMGKIAMNSNRFDATTNIEKWGFVKDGYVCFYPPAFSDRLDEGNFGKKSFISWAKKKNLVMLDKGRDTKVFKIEGKPLRAVALKIDTCIQTDDDGFVSIDDENEPNFV